MSNCPVKGCDAISCPQVWRVWDPDYEDADEAPWFHGYCGDDAAEQYAETRSDEDLYSGTVHVLAPDGSTNLYYVDSEYVQEFSARRLITEDDARYT